MKFKEIKSIYLQIADRICDEITLGKYKENERIPSVREYATIVEVNVNTIVKTFDYLQRQDLVYIERGRGYFVKKGAPQQIAKLQKKEFLNNQLPTLFKTMKNLSISIDEIEKLYKKYQKESDHFSS